MPKSSIINGFDVRVVRHPNSIDTLEVTWFNDRFRNMRGYPNWRNIVIVVKP